MQPKKDIPAFAMSRRTRNSIFFLCLLILILLVWLDRSLIGRRVHFTPKTEEQAIASDLRKYHGREFIVVNVIDGDTFDIDISDDRYERTRIRLLGIDAPETGGEESGVMYYGPEAAEFAKKLIFVKSLTIYLDSPNPTRDKYGRLLAYVKLPDGRFLNEVLLAEGYAYADSRFGHNFFNKYRQLQAGARSGQKGLWRIVKPDQVPEWLQKENPILPYK